MPVVVVRDRQPCETKMMVNTEPARDGPTATNLVSAVHLFTTEI
jgi:hypothetical protein